MAQSGLEGMLEIVGLEVTTESGRTATRLESWMQRVPDYRSCNTENAEAKLTADRWDGEQIRV